MAKKLKIGLDIDDVCVDFISAFRKEAEIVLGRTFEGPPGDWGFSAWGLTARDRDAIWHKILNTSNWFLFKAKFFLGVKRYLIDLMSHHEVTFITARPETPESGGARKEAIMQLGSYLGWGFFPQVIVAHDKGPIVKALGLDLFVDDKILNLTDIESAYLDSDEILPKLIIFNRSHNEHEHLEEIRPDIYSRVNGWPELMAKIKELE